MHVESTGGREDLDIVGDQLGSAEGIVFSIAGDVREEEAFRVWLERHHVDD
jgi:hypothetical protein